MKALAVLALARESGDGTYQATPLSRGLRAGGESSLHGDAVMSGTCLYDAWRQLEFSARTGSPAFGNVHGQRLWQYLDAEPEYAAHFARTMGSSSGYYLSDIMGVHDFSAARLLVDLGGGDGELVAQVLVRNPRLRAIAVDRPSTTWPCWCSSAAGSGPWASTTR